MRIAPLGLVLAATVTLAAEPRSGPPVNLSTPSAPRPAADMAPDMAPDMTPGMAPVVHGHRLSHRWVYIANNFQAEGNVERVASILERAADAGFNGALLADVKFGRLDDGSLIDAYYTNLRSVLERARDLGIATVPATADFGYSESILWHDPNLAAALPVQDAPFEVDGGRLIPLNEPPVELVNGDFEQLPESGHAFPGWLWQDAPGAATFVDHETRRDGRASLRMQDLATSNPPHGNGRIHQRLTVEPFRHYHVTVWIKTEAFRGGDVRVLVLGQNPERTLQWNSVPVKPDQDWTRFDVTFNTLTHAEVLFYFGVWGGGTGTIWWDSGSIEPAGLVNLVRREGAPVSAVAETGDTRLVEGRDIDTLVDPEMGQSPWSGSFDLWHEPPVIGVPAGSRLNPGDRVRLSWFHAVSVYGSQVTSSLTEPAVFDIVEGQMRSLRREFAAADSFSGWQMGHDEIRVHGWDQAPRFGDGSPGADLAGNVRRIQDLARAIDPAAAVYAWSDMYDPFHNAAQREIPYYLVNGDWRGAWEGLDPTTTILNWNHGPERRASAEFFANRGHRQILAGYYDAAPESFSDRQWLADLAGIPNVAGVMYTPWSSGYGNLEAWADHVWGDAEWAPENKGISLFVPVTSAN